MSRGPATFRQRDLTAAVKAMRAAGCEVARVEIGKDGRIIVVVTAREGGGVREEHNPWD